MEHQVLNCVKNFYKTLKESLHIKYSQFSNADIVIWGTGELGLKLFKLFIDFDLAQNVKAFCCSEVAKEQKILELPVLSAKEAREKFPQAVFIIASIYYKEILNSGLCNGLKIFVQGEASPLRSTEEILFCFHNCLSKNGFCGFNVNWFSSYFYVKDLKNKISAISNLLDDEKSKEILNNRMQFMQTGNVEFLRKIPIDKLTFFSNEYLDIGQNEVYVDCGAYNGDTVLSFNAFVKSKYKKVIAFEPSKEIYSDLVENVKKNKISNVITVKAGNGLQDQVLNFLNMKNEGSLVIDGDLISRLSEEDKSKIEKIRIEKLDNYIEEQPTFIKMDIEGYELEALKGSEQILRTLKPKLAICIYHKEMDFYEIPMYLKSIVPEYKFKIRQHYDALYDTVLYAQV